MTGFPPRYFLDMPSSLRNWSESQQDFDLIWKEFPNKATGLTIPKQWLECRNTSTDLKSSSVVHSSAKLRTRCSKAQFSWQSGNLILINHQSLEWLSSNSREMEISDSGLFSYSYLYRHYILILWIINNPYLSELVVSSNGIYKSQYICYCYMLHPRGLTGCSCFVKINLVKSIEKFICATWLSARDPVSRWEEGRRQERSIEL